MPSWHSRRVLFFWVTSINTQRSRLGIAFASGSKTRLPGSAHFADFVPMRMMANRCETLAMQYSHFVLVLSDVRFAREHLAQRRIENPVVKLLR